VGRLEEDGAHAEATLERYIGIDGKRLLSIVAPAEGQRHPDDCIRPDQLLVSTMVTRRAERAGGPS